MEQSEWIGSLLVESFLSQQSCLKNKAFLTKTFDYLNLSTDLLEQSISTTPARPMEFLFPIIVFKHTPEIDMDSPAIPQTPERKVYDDVEVKLEKFLALKMGKELNRLAEELTEAKSLTYKVTLYHKFIAEILPKASRVCQLIKYDSEEVLLKALENYFCPAIYDLVFPLSVAEDAAFSVQTAKLRSKESFLGVTPEIIQKIRNVVTLAGAELDQMERHISPYAKLACTAKCLDILLQVLGHVGADDLLPAVIYTVVQCNPSRLPSNLKYIMMFGNESAFNTNLGYCHTTLMVAMEVITTFEVGLVGGEASNDTKACPKCQGIGGLNCFGEPCRPGENLYHAACPTCSGTCIVTGSPKRCEQCAGKGGKAKLGYCEVTDPFAVGRCEVCAGKGFMLGTGPSSPVPTSPLASFSQYYGTELTPSKYGFYRQSSSMQVERVMLPDLLSVLVLFSLTSSVDPGAPPRSRRKSRAFLSAPSSSFVASSLSPSPPPSPLSASPPPYAPSSPPTVHSSSTSLSSLSPLSSSTAEVDNRNATSAPATESPILSHTPNKNTPKKPTMGTKPLPLSENKSLAILPTKPSRRHSHNYSITTTHGSTRRTPKAGWRIGVKKEITVFYPAPVRSALKRLIHCLRSLGSVAKRDKERDDMLEGAERAIAIKCMHEMTDGRALLSGEGYGINLGSDGVKEIYFHRVDNEPNQATLHTVPHMHALIAVMGVIDPDLNSTTDDLDAFMRQQIHVDCDKYVLVWETQHLRRFGNTVKFFHHSSVQAARSSSAFPLAPVMIAQQFKNAGVLANHPYIYLLQQAKKGGRILAEKLIRMGLGKRPVTLVGVSFGALLVFSCLEVLLESAALTPHVCSLVENAIFIGANIPADTVRWNAIKPTVSGRIINCFSTKDTFLKYFYQTVHSLTGGTNCSASGVTAIPVTNIENVDVSSLITSHAFYSKNQIVSTILNFVDVGGVECNLNYNPKQPKRKSTTPPPAPPPPPPPPPPPAPEEESLLDKIVHTLQSYFG